MTSQRIRSIFAASLFAMLVPISASADIINPDEEICETKAVGDECNLDGGGTGTCIAATCSRLDYSETPPATVEYECKRCEAANEGEPATNGGTNTGGGETNTGETNTGGDTTGPADEPKDDGGGCSVSSVTGGSPLTAVSFFLGACLFGGLLRRRSKR